MHLDAARCYRALSARDRRFDGRFFVGVRTTGVYCRPVCPARTPKPANVRFYRCAAAAEAAGFRPCLRCRPETAPGTPAWNGTPAVVERALRLLARGALDEAGVDPLAERLGIGSRHLRRLFDRHVGAGPLAVARTERVHFARRLLDETDLPVTRVADAAGFRSIRQFNHAFRQTFRHPPSTVRRARAGAVATFDGYVLRLPFRPPFAWHALRDFLAVRATPGVEVVDGDTYRRTITVGDAAGTLAVSLARGALRLEVGLPHPAALYHVAARARRMFDVDADPARIAAELRREPVLLGRLAAVPGLRIPGAWDPFECAVRTVVGQQVSVRAATTLTGRLAREFGRPADRATPGLTHLFPDPAALRGAPLERVGLVAARAAAIRALAAAVDDGVLALDGSQPIEHVAEGLRALPGIGEWTVQYVLLRALGEPDAFPAGDLGLRRAAAAGTRSLSERALAERAEAWRPWRGYAAMYLWTKGASR